MPHTPTLQTNDANEEVESPPPEVRSPRAVGAAADPQVHHGGPGSAVAGVAATLDGTGLELAAQRVLAKRGIDAVDAQALRALPTLRGVAAEPPLRDVLEASERSAPLAAGRRSVIGATAAESVIGEDSRSRVLNTREYPYSAIASLEITAQDGSRWAGTGWFVSARTVVTAGHCVFIHDALHAGANGWVRSVRVVPGRNGTGPGSEPFGSAVATRFRSVRGWVDTGEATSDYGAILLPEDHPLGDQVGTFGLGAFDDVRLDTLNLNLAGYPADKKAAERNTLWFDVKQTRLVTDTQVFYDIDTYGGQSGAPVYVADGSQRVAVAIHAYGTSATTSSNSGTRVNAKVLARLQAWKS